MMNGEMMPEQAPLKVYRGRILVLKIALLALVAVVLGRLVKIQILDAARYQEMAKRQYEVKVGLPAMRGSVYDRNGNVLVSNTRTVSYAADPKMIGDEARHVAKVFSNVFRKSESFYLEKLGSAKRFVWLERHVKPDEARRIALGDIDGVVELEEPQRLYHYDDFAGQVLGFTDIDNNGISGVELQCEEVLRGSDGFVVMQRDGLGRKRPSVDYPRVDPTDGNDVTLTLDFAYQSIVQEELKRGVEQNNAQGGMAVMLRPQTGEILAMATYPSVHPASIDANQIANFRNRPLTDMFEPGSTFKIVVASAALEDKLHKPGDTFFAENGVYHTGSRTIRDTHKYGTLSFMEAMELSSNIVMAKISDEVGPERFFRTARDFGFGMPTGVELPGEIGGQLKRPSQWSGTTLNTMAYGYEVGVTPIQIAAAYGAIANGGVLMRPFIIRKAARKDGTMLFERSPEEIRRVVSEETARTLTSFFEGVVEQGTAKNVKLDGVRIAGKTGTAMKLGDAGYSKEDYLSSFVGYFPADDPKVVLLVMIDTPRAGQYYGGLVAGPVFKAIAGRIINLSDAVQRPEIARQYARDIPANERVTVPDVRFLGADAATAILTGAGATVSVAGSGTIVADQRPATGIEIARNDRVEITLADPSAEGGDTGGRGPVQVPDCRGLTLRRALNALTIRSLDGSVNGSGIVVRQEPSPGDAARRGARVTLWCEPVKVSSQIIN